MLDIWRHRPSVVALRIPRTLRHQSSRGYAWFVSRRNAILHRHREAIRAAASRNNASSIALAGSVARGTDATHSDCDFVVEFADGATMLDMAGLELDLIDLLGCEVDVCARRALQPPYDSMLEDAITL